jgi:hypothetical protein
MTRTDGYYGRMQARSKELILEYLLAADWKVLKAAEAAKLNRATLYKLIQMHGIELPPKLSKRSSTTHYWPFSHRKEQQSPIDR